VVNVLILLAEADAEYTAAAEWYETQKDGLGERFINIIQARLLLIQQYPERYPKRKGNFREAPVLIFPYTIIYTFYKSKQIITVSAIYHGSRNPKKKFRR